MTVAARGIAAPGKRRLLKELEMFKKDNSLGIRVELAKSNNGMEILEEWEVFIDGPPDTVYEGYVLHARMEFPRRYPFEPPKFKFLTPMFHPNIYIDGVVCISILHQENDELAIIEKDDCAWSPGQSVRTICLSIISLLDSPNIYSPANVDASKMLRDDKEGYFETVKKLLKEGNRKANN